MVSNSRFANGSELPFMAQTKDDFKSAEGGKKPTYRIPTWLLFLISALAIFFSPFGFFGLLVAGFSTLMQNNLLSWTVEVIFFIVGFIPFAILADRREYALSACLLTFAIINLGIILLAYWLW